MKGSTGKELPTDIWTLYLLVVRSRLLHLN